MSIFDDAEAAFAEPERKPPPAKSAALDIPKPELERVSAPGAYNLAEDSYHADPCPEPSLSGSLIKALLKRSPRHAWEMHPRLNLELERKESATFDMGSAFHKLILGKGKELAPLDFKDWKTDAAKAARKAAYARGEIPLLIPQHQKATEMAQAVRAQIAGWEELAFAMAEGVPELTLIWQEETPFGPVWARCMLDWIPTRGDMAPDWKSTQIGAGPDEWGAKTAWALDIEIQAAWNRRAMRKVLGRNIDLFFAVAEIEAPHALACMRPSHASVAMADRQIEGAIASWGWCLKNNRFPGYRREMAWIEMPAWKERGLLEREERGEFDIQATIAMLEAAGPSDNRNLKAYAEGEEEGLDAFGLAPIGEANQ